MTQPPQDPTNPQEPVAQPTPTAANAQTPQAEHDPVREAFTGVRTEIAKAVVGQDQAVTGMLIALLCQGHVLLEGVPGVAKPLLVRSFAAAVSLDISRVQFTPDLMPSDVTGSLVYDASASDF